MAEGDEADTLKKNETDAQKERKLVFYMILVLVLNDF